jgi:hypothetical protein
VFLAILIGTILVGTADQAQATGLMFYALEDGQVRGFDIDTGDDSISIPASAFFGIPPNPATERNIAYDPVTDLMWYSADDNHVHSVVVSTLAAGPTISDIGDSPPNGAIRTIAIDRSARRLYISNSNGNVEVYELINNTRMYTIPLSAFGYGEPNPGNRRRLAADAWSFLWFAAADGTFKEFDPVQHNPRFTGREIPVNEQIDPSFPGQQRCFVAVRWSTVEHYLHYASSDGTVRTANLDTLTNVTITYPASWFLTSSNPGELRSLAIDPTWTPSGTWPSPPTGITASDGVYPDAVQVSWNPVANADNYVLYRRVFGTSTWGAITVLLITTSHYDTVFIVPGEIYEYAVKATNQWGWSDLSTDTDTGYAGGLTPPTGVTASQGTLYDRVRVSWDAVSGATGYLVGRAPEGGGIPTTDWVTGTTYDDMNALPAGSFWEYWVYACTDPSFCSSSSESVWGWIGTYIFIDGFESGDMSEWSSVQY